jgi:2-C-methyl-D-erythritol 4-phosphate cytidylyltransferase
MATGMERIDQVGVVVCAPGTPGAGGAGQDAQLAGRPLLVWAVAAMEANRSVAAVAVTAPRKAVGAAAKLLADHGFAKLVAVVGGGRTRQASVAAALAALPAGLEYVAVHDAARPLADHGLVDRLLEALVTVEGPLGAETGAGAGVGSGSGCAGVVPGVPVTDTVRRVDSEGRSGGVVDRTVLRAVQTPQLFRRSALEAAHRHALQEGLEATDDATLMERAGHPVAVVAGSAENLRVATPLDLLVAEAMLERRRRRGT